ncbi:uncharacterized protein LOC116611696 [Nematostella vectensis]|uniref:uncharacterized protein LOC116611696 n=1 Tax=Nematostella vectensis TaxID=45351 RepID=UPI0020775DCE|nr:uncharacterized protein LOC116611696 [Nematostella vectensis]
MLLHTSHLMDNEVSPITRLVSGILWFLRMVVLGVTKVVQGAYFGCRKLAWGVSRHGSPAESEESVSTLCAEDSIEGRDSVDTEPESSVCQYCPYGCQGACACPALDNDVSDNVRQELSRRRAETLSATILAHHERFAQLIADDDQLAVTVINKFYPILSNDTRGLMGNEDFPQGMSGTDVDDTQSTLGNKDNPQSISDTEYTSNSIASMFNLTHYSEGESFRARRTFRQVLRRTKQSKYRDRSRSF